MFLLAKGWDYEGHDLTEFVFDNMGDVVDYCEAYVNEDFTADYLIIFEVTDEVKAVRKYEIHNNRLIKEY